MASIECAKKFKEGEFVMVDGKVRFFIKNNDDRSVTIFNTETKSIELVNEVKDCDNDILLLFCRTNTPLSNEIVSYDFEIYRVLYDMYIGDSIETVIKLQNVNTENEIDVFLSDLLYNKIKVDEFEKTINCKGDYKLGTIYGNGFTLNGRRIQNINKAFEFFSKQLDFILIKVKNLTKRTDLNGKFGVIESNCLNNGRIIVNIHGQNRTLAVKPENILFIDPMDMR